MELIGTVAIWIVGIELIITAGFGVLVLWDKIRRGKR